MDDATSILNAMRQGDSRAAEQLLALVYDELRKLAAFKMSQEAPGQTLQPTALVHEAWLRLTGRDNLKFEDRTHFFCTAAEAMRRILIDRARRKRARRHGGDFERMDFDKFDFAAPQADDQLLAVDEALEELGRKHPAQPELVKLRYFGGMTIEETAQVMNISVSTAKNYWAYSRAWLYEEIQRKS